VLVLEVEHGLHVGGGDEAVFELGAPLVEDEGHAAGDVGDAVVVVGEFAVHTGFVGEEGLQEHELGAGVWGVGGVAAAAGGGDGVGAGASEAVGTPGGGVFAAGGVQHSG
jgi:hypothetical protein